MPISKNCASSIRYLLLTFIFLIVALGSARASDVVINEFMAANETTLQDENGDYSDWIELKNVSGATVDLDGWFLTDSADDLTNWAFPAVQIAPNGYLLVFASSKDRAVAGSELHTNFKLNGGGEYLALIKNDGRTIADAFSPEYPIQEKDISYGRLDTTTNTVTLLEVGAACRIHVPLSGSLGTNWWARTGVDDTGWMLGITGVGYDQRGTYEPIIATDIETQMHNINRTCYLRIPFLVNDPQAFDALALDIKYDDGFVAYVNGHVLASINAPASPLWNSSATAEHENPAALAYEHFLISDIGNVLTAGTNILAIHGLNFIDPVPFAPVGFLNIPRLSGATITHRLEYFLVPTPGAENNGVAPVVQATPDGGTFTGSMSVTLSASIPGAQIRYTLDGTEPTLTSTLYAGTLILTLSKELRARAYSEALLPGPILRRGFLRLAGDMASFSSDVPIIIVENFGGGNTDGSNYKSFQCMIFEPDASGRGSPTHTANVSTRIGIKERGSSTAGRDKASYTLEAWNDSANAVNISPLGMPPESDWVLYGPYDFDRAMMRNALIYTLGNQVGQYAPRVRVVELFRNIGGGDVSYADDYRGVYIWMEKIKRDKNRVDIDRLDASDLTEPDISGGYIFKIDRTDPGDSGFTAGGQSMSYVEPKEIEMEGSYSVQDTWLKSYINAFGNALSGVNFRDPAAGYRAYFDVEESIDYFILKEFMTRDPDQLRLSTYLHKPREGKMTFGPIWDYDRTMGSYDGRDANPLIWTDYAWTYGWWNRLFDDPDFWQQMIDRWQELRLDTLSESNVFAQIDILADQMSEAQLRNYSKWTGLSLRNGNWESEVDHLRGWLSNRVNWCDSQFIAPPRFSTNSPIYTVGDLVTLTAAGGEDIYYTTDGSDPRPRGGAAPSPGATLYTAPIELLQDVILTARAWDGRAFGTVPASAPWSGPATRAFVNNPAELMVSELMYNPRPADDGEIALGYSQGDFEYIEFRNTTAVVGSLVGVRIEGGITFSFEGSPVQWLSPGAHLLIVRNLDAFNHRYTNAPPASIAGVFSGSLNDSGERIDVIPYAPEPGPWSFTYSDDRDWPQSSDGAGHSLVPLSLARSRGGSLDYGRYWRASAFIDGSPGVADPTPVHDLLINEILAHTDYNNGAHPEYDSNDAIELYNASGSPVAFTDWYLSDDILALTKWPLPSTQALASAAHVWFDEVSGFHRPITNGFGLNKDGEQVFLSYLPGTEYDRVVDAFRFKGQENGISEGRYPDGGPYWTALTPTPGTTNALPAAHVHFSEIMYHPAPTVLNPEDNTLGEYIEIHNPLATRVDLWTSAGRWRISGGVSYTFPALTTLAPGERIVLLPFDPLSDPANRLIFENEYGLTNGQARLMGPYQGKLNNNSERLTLEKPQDPDFPSVITSWVIVDELVYLDESPWPGGTDATGAGVQRISTQGAGADPSVWINGFIATPGAPGTVLSIAAPEHGSRYIIPYALQVVAAIDPSQVSNPVAQVAFYDGAEFLCSVTQKPYRCTLSLDESRNYVITAVLTDASGVTTSRQSVVRAIHLYTQPANGITEDTATLHAAISGGDTMDTIAFYWGDAHGGTNSAAWDEEVRLSSPPGQTYSLVLNDLTPGKTYYCRAYGEIDGHTGWSSNAVSFTTFSLNQWPHQLAIRFPNGPADPLINFPVLVRLHEGLTNFSYAQFASPQAFDLRLSDAGTGEVLAYEIEEWNPAGMSYIWVRVPSFTSNTTLHAHWGLTNAAALAPSYTSNGSTWSEHFEAVWHLTPPLLDAAGRQPPATDVNTSNAAGCVGPGRGFAGTNAFLSHGPGSSWINSAQEDLTLSLWVRASSGLPSSATPFGTTGGGSGSPLYFSANTLLFVKKWNVGVGPVATATRPYQLDNWQRLALTMNNGTVYAIFNDDAPVLIGSGITLNLETPLTTGRRDAPGANFLGAIDEIRFSSITRSSAWLKASYDTIANHDAFTHYGVVGPPATDSDLDANGIPDAWEQHYFTTSNIDPNGHSDNDGMNDYQEFVAGTDPTHSASLFDVQIVSSNTLFTVRFFARKAQGAGYETLERYYDLQSASPFSNTWTWTGVPLMTNILGLDHWAIYTNTTPTGRDFYRARATLK